jgi:hypothetical protein
MSLLDTLNKDAGSKFYRIALTSEDEKLALGVSPLFLAYLQNKIEAYATALVDTPLVYDPDPTKQVATIVTYERTRAFVQAYEELLAELLDAQETNMAEANLR